MALPMYQPLVDFYNYSTRPGLTAARTSALKAVPSATANAVVAAQQEGTDQPAYPTQFRQGYESGASSVPQPKPPTGSVEKYAPNGMDPYPINMTNAQGPGGRAATPDYGVRFPSIPAPVAAGAARVGGVGMLPPEFHQQIGDLLDQATPLLKSGGIVDRLRGRGLLKARSRLIEGATAIAGQRTQGINAETGQVNADANTLASQTGAYRATNEVPLALLGAATHRYATDTGARTAEMQDATHRFTNEANNDTLRRGQDANVAVHLPTIQREAAINEAISRGDMDTAESIGRVGKYEPQPRSVATVDVPMAGGVMRGDKFYSYKDLQLQDVAAKKKALDEANAAKLK